MIFFQKSKITLIYSLLKKPYSLKQAFILSVLLHGFVFLLFPIFVSKQDVVDFPEKLLTVDVVSISPKSPYRKLNKKINQITPTKKYIINKNNHQKPNISNSNKHDTTFEKTSPQEKNREVLFGALLPILPRKGFVRELKLLPPVKVMSRKQQKFFVKKSGEIIEKLQQLPLSDSVMVWQDKKRTYRVKIRHEKSESITGLDQVIFDVTTHENGLAMSTEMRLRQMAFSNYAQFVDYWDPTVAIHNDECSGRFHSNTSFNISRRYGIAPKFYGKVTTASYQIKMDRQPFTFDDPDVFNGGLERGIKAIAIPKRLTPFTSETKIDSCQIHFLKEETWIVFNKHGTYSWKTKRQSENFSTKVLPKEKPFFIVVNKKVKIHIQGTVNGKVLIYSIGNIFIDDDIVYASHPERFYHSENYLGLVSLRDVVIAEPSVTGPGDLNICAAIFAKGLFRVSNFQKKSGGMLHIYGSLSAGTISATEPRYATKIIFDKRLDKKRPPNFPLTDRFEIVEWDRQWKVREL